MRIKILKIAFVLVLLFYFLSLVAQPVPETPLWFIDILMHEAGHWIFSLFGEFMYVLGGSLNQVLVPCLFVGYFFIRKEYYSASIVLYWVGENLLSVAAYAHDAIAQALPLFGGDGILHDWNVIFIDIGQLHNTYVIAAGIKVVAVLCILAAAAGGVYFVINPQEIKSSVNQE
jgi:hypothetical protein